MMPRSERAVALLLVLWSIALLALLAGGIAYATRQDIAISNLQMDRMTAHWLARAGVERAMAELIEDLTPIDGEGDRWYDAGAAMKDVALTGGTFSVTHDDYADIPRMLYGVGDESAKLNLSGATREQLMKLPYMTESIAAAILDWSDKNDEPEPQGAEGGFYEGQTHPYRIRNGPLRSIGELLLVRDVTPELYYGEDVNGNGLLDPNENDGPASAPDDNADGRLDRGWCAYLTPYTYERNENALGTARVNITKADASTLQQRLGLESWAAESIVKARERNEVKHLADLLKVQRDPSVVRDDSPESNLNNRSENEKDQPVTVSIFKSIIDDLTTKDEEMLPGRININTASRAVVKTLPGITDELADAIFQSRTAGGFRSIADLLTLSGMTTEKFGELEEKITMRSSVFRIRSMGESASGLGRATIECVVDRGARTPRVLYWSESVP